MPVRGYSCRPATPRTMTLRNLVHPQHPHHHPDRFLLPLGDLGDGRVDWPFDTLVAWVS